MTNLPSPSKDLAVKLALENKWKEAYEENKRLLEENPNDVDSLNRIAYSLVKLGKFKKAKEYYQLVIKLWSVLQTKLQYPRVEVKKEFFYQPHF